MPIVEFQDHTFECEIGDNLRRVLMSNELPLYNGIAKAIHCRGLGTCGTCAVGIEGEVTPITKIERWRLNFPPHSAESGLRLACQCRVQGDLVVSKSPGLWGHRSGSKSEKPTAE
ncbi:MAG: 2Fe-2S iron-sulfur cluster-binding protein [Rubripirellula sp.]